MPTRQITRALGSIGLGHLTIMTADVYLSLTLVPENFKYQLRFRELLLTQLVVHFFFFVRVAALLLYPDVVQHGPYGVVVNTLWLACSGFILYISYFCSEAVVLYLLFLAGTSLTVCTFLVEYSAAPLVGNSSSAVQEQEQEQEQDVSSVVILDVSSECSVCLERYVAGSVGRLACGHRFHHHCIIQWLRDHNTCPLCRGVAR